MDKVIVVAEQRERQLTEVSLELLPKATELALILNGTASAILIGSQCRNLADQLIAYGAPKVFWVDHPHLDLYQSDVYAKITASILTEMSPEIVLIGETSIGIDLASRVAAKLRTGLTAHCIDVYIEKIDQKEQLIHIVPGWGGKMMVKIICPDRRPQMATIRPGMMEKVKPDPSRTGNIISIHPDITEYDFRAKTVEMVKERRDGKPLEEAEIIVAGGFGLYSAGGFGLIEQLAAALDGEVAGTRPACDHGWIPENRMIGQSGKMVRPKLFVSIGASGAAQYTTGFLKSRVIVGIDKNPRSQIFNVADFGIVEDLRKIIPFLIEGLKQ
jgi:electron transfer flavoprotein alpha subunit